jgi:hypothetical protein
MWAIHFRGLTRIAAVVCVMVLATVEARPQATYSGIVSFNNGGAPLDKRIWVGATGNGVLAAGTAYQTALFWALDGSCDESLFTQVGGNVGLLTGAAAGSFFGSGRTISYGLPPANGATLLFQVRAWVVEPGVTGYENARTTGKSLIFRMKTKDPSVATEPTPSLGQAADWTGFAIRTNGFAPEISNHPCDQSNEVGSDFVFSVTATGVEPLFYVWQFNKTNIVNATNSSLTITNAQLYEQGFYRAVISNEFGITITRPARLQLVARTLTVLTEGSGAVSKLPDKPSYALNEEVLLTAIPGRWHRFDHWSDGSTENPHSVIMSGPLEYSAHFSPTTAVETVTIGSVSRTAPIGMPAILVDGVFITEGAVTNFGRAEIRMETTLPNGLVFWTLDGKQPDILTSPVYTGPFQLTRSAVLRTVAYASDFSKSVEGDPIEITIIPTYQLATSTPGGGQVTVEPASSEYVSNSIVTLTAVAGDGWRFLGWLGDFPHANDTNTTVQLTIKRNQCVEAIFGTSLATTIAGSGNVAVTPDVEWYPYGTVVQLFAVADAGHAFALWSNAGVSTNNPLQLSMTMTNPTVGAVFQSLSAGQFALAVNSDGLGQVNVSPRANRYLNRQNVTLTATPDPFQTFVGWSGDAIGTQNPLTLSMTQSRIITAHFTRRPILAVDRCSGSVGSETLRFVVRGELGGIYTIEHSTDLANWETLKILTNLLGVCEWHTDTSGVTFFRATFGP